MHLGRRQCCHPNGTRASPSKLLLGIRHAEGQFVHLANPRVTRSYRRRWTGLVVALSVTLTVCDAQQVGLSPSYRFLLISPDLAAFQNKRPEQKAPQAMGTWRIFNQTLSSRGPASGASRYLDGTKAFQYALAPLTCLSSPFCLRVNSCESPRAPPRMDPPTFC